MAATNPYRFECPCGETVEIPLSISLGDRQPDGSVFAELHADPTALTAHIDDKHPEARHE
jgi:hypothetical protein